MRFSVLSSGSRANCTVVQCGETTVLIDCGLSGKEAARRLALIGIDIQTLDALVVTHEHSDHVSGIHVLSNRFGLPVFCNKGAAPSLEKCRSNHVEFFTGSDFAVGSLTFHPFSIPHDASDPVGLRVEGNGHILGHLTDLGRVTSLVTEKMQELDALVLESNHEPDLLFDCDYPWQVKQRIGSSHGHLSNQSAAQFLESILSDRLKVLVLAHLSEQSNAPELARYHFQKVCPPSLRYLCAGPLEPTELICLKELLHDEESAVVSPIKTAV